MNDNIETDCDYCDADGNPVEVHEYCDDGDAEFDLCDDGDTEILVLDDDGDTEVFELVSA